MNTKSAVHGARAAADIKEAAKTAANSRSTQASKQASAHAPNVSQRLLIAKRQYNIATATV